MSARDDWQKRAMVAPIKLAWLRQQGARAEAYWFCRLCLDMQSGDEPTLAAAADAGRAHLREHHAHPPSPTELAEFWAGEPCKCSITPVIYPMGVSQVSAAKKAPKTRQEPAEASSAAYYGPPVDTHSETRTPTEKGTPR